MRIHQWILAFGLLLNLASAHAGDSPSLKAGVTRVNITPDLPFWLTGYASRTAPAKEVLHSIWAKVLVLEQSKDNRIIFVTVDVLGLSKEIVEDVFTALHAQFGIQRSQLLINSSHTHAGPMIWPCLNVIYDFDEAEQARIATYTQRLSRQIVGAVEEAMRGLFPAKVFTGKGSAGFAINRRDALFPKGAVDHDVPVLKVESEDHSIKAVLFGYACHNTTLVDKNNLISGDYAGVAQTKIEAAHPGATALFLMGCAGDQNPYPRGTSALVEQHSTELANAVGKVLMEAMNPVRAPIRTEFQVVSLSFRPVDRSVFQQDILSSNKFLQRRARLMLEAYNNGWNTSQFSYPIQAVRFNNDFTILGLSDEVVVDYSILYKKTYPRENLFVAGYCNDVQLYVPSKKVLDEGGYEGGESMIYYGHPGPFADDVEDRITNAVHKVMRRVGAKKY